MISLGGDRNVKKLLISQKRAMRISFVGSPHSKHLFEYTICLLPLLCIFSYACNVKSNNYTTNSLVNNHNTRFREQSRMSQCNFQDTIRIWIISFELSFASYLVTTHYLMCRAITRSDDRAAELEWGVELKQTTRLTL